MNPSSTWESFSTFLDQQQNPNQPAPGQMPDWSQNFQLGQRPNYNPRMNIEGSSLFPGVPLQPQYPGIPSNFNSNQPTPYQQPGNNQYAAQQVGGVTAPSQAMDPAGGLFARLGQSKKHGEQRERWDRVLNTEQRERNRGGAYGSHKRDTEGNWFGSFNR